MALRDIETFVIVILENRSFDHACGYLSLDSADPPMQVDGLRNDPAWREQFINNDRDGTPTPIHELPPSTQNIADPPHEYSDIDIQINTPTHGNASPKMGGFVKSYFNADPRQHDHSLVMGYYTKDAVPVFDFFARNYAICDKWFSPLPAGTQANRLMAMSGESRIAHNVANPMDFPNQTLVYDWLSTTCGDDSWCSYQWGGLPFFSLMPRWWGRMMGSLNDQLQTGPFRHYEKFKDHWQANGDIIPNVVFIILTIRPFHFMVAMTIIVQPALRRVKDFSPTFTPRLSATILVGKKQCSSSPMTNMVDSSTMLHR